MNIPDIIVYTTRAQYPTLALIQVPTWQVPQTKFPVPPGIINNRGSNILAVSFWAQIDAGAKLDTVSLISYGQYETDFVFSRDWGYLQPGWTRDRLEYG